MTGNSNFLNRHKKAFLFICIVIWICAFGFTHIPADELPKFPTGDKTLHVVGFAGLAVFFLLTLLAYQLKLSTTIILFVLILPLYAALDEITQPLVNRHASLSDWVADICGAGIVLVIFLAAYLIFRQSPKSE